MSHKFYCTINGAQSSFTPCSAFFPSLGETESDRTSAYVEEIRIGGTSYLCLWREEDLDFFADRFWDDGETAPERWGSDSVSDLATVIFDDGKPLDLATVCPIGDIIFSEYIKAGIGSHAFLEDVEATLNFLHGTPRGAEADSVVDGVSSSRVSELAKLANGQNRAVLSELALALSRQLHTLGVKSYADNFTESDIPTLRKLAKMPRRFFEPPTLFWRDVDEVYPDPQDDPRYVSMDEVVENIVKGESK